MQAKHMGLGVKYGGRCGVCGRDTGSRPFEMAVTALYKREDGKFTPVHPHCAGGATKNAVGGGAKYKREPEGVIEVQ